VSPRRSAILLLLIVSLLLPAAGSAGAYSTGIGDQQTEMFTDTLWTQLNTRIARYIAPYDAAARPDELATARAWITAATLAHQQVLVAFYHSEHTPSRMPSPGVYRSDVQKFIRLFPQVRQYQAWNEANRGNVAGLFHSPTASQAAVYYKTLRGVCHGCQLTGLDILDQNNYRPTLRYIAQFRSDLRHLHVPTPRLWGLHNYSDTNRFSGTRTKAILRAVPGQVWLTETGGIVQFGGAFPNRQGSGDTRAAKALRYMFGLASSNPRITRLYIFQWSGASAQARFDAGLLDTHLVPRPGYAVVCLHMHAARCSGFAVDAQH
jgi:hypothetical protein